MKKVANVEVLQYPERFNEKLFYGVLQSYKLKKKVDLWLL